MTRIKAICTRINQLKEDHGPCSNQLIRNYVDELISVIRKIENTKLNYISIFYELSDTFNTKDIENIFIKANWK